MERRLRLEGKIIVLTGASSGLGAHFAPILHDAGAHVVLIARRKDRLAEVAASLTRTSQEALDVRDEEAVEAAVRRILSEHGRIDVLVNNAGIWAPGPGESESTSQFRDVIETNLTALFTVTRHVAQGMLARAAGSIINISSINGLKGVSASPASYSASKAGVNGLTMLLAAQWGPRGVRVNAIAPGSFPTELNNFFRDPQEVAAWAPRTAMGRIGNSDELDGLLLYLASDESSYVTGQVISVDGGWSAI
jgi:NAD(P)-dependent dehydrogenase (short-subunit alcohol dehydrogenase family)